MNNIVIVIPVFNAEKFIRRSLESCISQTIKTEIWVVNNCSSDKTNKIVCNYQKNHKNIKLFNNEKNLGRVGNWNRCLDLFAKSNFKHIKFVFSGDIIKPNCVEILSKYIKKYPEVGSIAFPYEFILPNGKIRISNKYRKNESLFSPKESIKLQLKDGGFLGAIICCLYAKKAIGKKRFELDQISKLTFDLEVSKNYYSLFIPEVLARFNTDSHNTFNHADSSKVFFEFAYIKSNMLYKYTKEGIFSEKESRKITQDIILYSIKDQITYIDLKNIYKIMIIILIYYPKRLLKTNFIILINSKLK